MCLLLAFSHIFREYWEKGGREEAAVALWRAILYPKHSYPLKRFSSPPPGANRRYARDGEGDPSRRSKRKKVKSIDYTCAFSNIYWW